MTPFDPAYWEAVAAANIPNILGYYPPPSTKNASMYLGISKFLKFSGHEWKNAYHELTEHEAFIWLERVVHPECDFVEEIEAANREVSAVRVAITVKLANSTTDKFFYMPGVAFSVLAAKRDDGKFRVAIMSSSHPEIHDPKEWANSLGRTKPTWRSLSDDWEPTWRETEHA